MKTSMKTYLQNLVLMNRQLNQNQQFRKHLVKLSKKSNHHEPLNHPSEMALIPLPPVIYANNLNQEISDITSEPASTNQTQLAFPKKNDTISITCNDKK